ncbi:19878_t:CDS:1, partial [Cetraspora pellucida]
ELVNGVVEADDFDCNEVQGEFVDIFLLFIVSCSVNDHFGYCKEE